MQERVRMGAAQIAPELLDKEGTLEETLATIREAGRLGLDLLVFPETYCAAYPYWRGEVPVRRSTELIVAMQRRALQLPGDEVRDPEEEAWTPAGPRRLGAGAPPAGEGGA